MIPMIAPITNDHMMVPAQAQGQTTPIMIVLGVGDKLAALLIITGALSVVLVTASVLLLISRDKKFVTKEKLSCCNRMHGSEENSIKAVSDTVLGDNPTYGDIQPHKLKEMTNGAMTEQSQDNTAPTMASTLFQNANDRSLTINGSHSYEYVTTRRIDYGVHREHRDQVEGQGRPIEESTESSDIYYSIEYTQSRRTGVQLLQIKQATSQRAQLPSRTHSTQTFISNTSIPQHYETMENVLSHKQITAISVDDSVTLHPMQ